MSKYTEKVCAQISEGCVLAPDVWILGTCPCGTCFDLLPLAVPGRKGEGTLCQSLPIRADSLSSRLHLLFLQSGLHWCRLGAGVLTSFSHGLVNYAGHRQRTQCPDSNPGHWLQPVTSPLQKFSSSSWNIKMIPKSESWETNRLSDVPYKLSENQKYTPLLQKYPHHRNDPETKHAWNLHRHCQIIRGTPKNK